MYRAVRTKLDYNLYQMYLSYECQERNFILFNGEQNSPAQYSHTSLRSRLTWDEQFRINI